MHVVVLCPGCGTQNAVSVSFCAECRTSLERGARVSRNEAQRTIEARADRALKLRLRIYAVLAIAIVVVATWVSYSAYDFFSYPDPPSTNISAEPALGDWPMYQRDPAHSGSIPDTLFMPEGKIHWIFETDGLILNSPVVVQDAVYLSTGNQFDYNIVALDADTGMLLWEHPVAAPIDSSLAVAGDLAFVTMSDGSLLALNASDGTVHWVFDAGSPLFGSPTVYRGTVYIGTWDKKIYALDAATGGLLWNRKVGGRVTSGPVVNEEVIAFNATNNFVYILDVRDGSQRLKFRVSETTGSVAVNGQRVYVADLKGGLRAIDWTESHFPFEEKIRAVRSNLFALGLIETFPTRKGSVWNVRRRNEPLPGTPAVANGMIYVTSASGKVFKFQEADGKSVWTFDAGAAASESVSVTPHYVVVGDARGRVHVIDVDSGESIRRFEVNGFVASAPVITSDTLYVATANGKLYAIR